VRFENAEPDEEIFYHNSRTCAPTHILVFPPIEIFIKKFLTSGNTFGVDRTICDVMKDE